MASKKKIIGSGVDVQTAAGVSALTVDETSGQSTMGPTAFTIDTKHQINGQLSTYSSGLVQVTTGATNVIDFNGKMDGMYLVSAVRQGANVGNNGLWLVGNSAGTPIIYAIISASQFTASVATTFFKIASNGTHNIYCNALRLVGGS